MAITTRTITNAGTPFLDAAGNIAAETIIFQLVNVQGQPEDMWCSTGERISSFPISVTLDSNGEFSIDLATTDQSISPLYYKCTCSSTVNGVKTFRDFIKPLNAGVGSTTFLAFRQGST